MSIWSHIKENFKNMFDINKEDIKGIVAIYIIMLGFGLLGGLIGFLIGELIKGDL